MLKFDLERKIWSEVDCNADNKKDELPSIDSHSLIACTKEDKTVLYTLCGFIGANVGKDTSSVHCFDTSTCESKCVYDCFAVGEEEKEE